MRNQVGLVKGSLLALLLITNSTAPAWAQGRASGPNNSDVPVEVQQRNFEIQKILDRSTERFQTGEAHFNAGDYAQARREYDKAVDIVLEAGIDVRSDARLKQHYKKLIEHIYQRQVGLLRATPATQQAQNAVAVQQTAQSGQPQSAPASDQRGFGQQVYTASPLDDLQKLELTEAETKGATEAEAKSSVAAARLDFGFKPNALIQSYINYYTGRGRVTMETGLRRSGRYMQMTRRIFKEEGVPEDLAWLGQVESAWSPVARSWAAAVGLWQFIPATGARYGLQQNAWVDERSSFEKATRASARYLKFLANRYAGNWELAMAAYNTGEGNIDRAIARSGYADFWEIYSRGLIANETKNYVPNILATIIIAKNPEAYGFNVKPDPALAYDTVVVNNAVDLELVADACDTSEDYLRALNPELKRGMTPPGLQHALRVPPGRGKQLQSWLTRIPADKRTSWRLMTAQNGDSFEAIAKRAGVSESTLSAINGGVEPKPGQKIIIPSGSGLARNVAAVAPKGTMTASAGSGGYTRMIVYTVKPGETVTDIAARYGVSARDLTALNRISANAKLRAGQTLKVPTRGR
jgi:membrane-bound lytic murein transglycosylase D